MSERRENEEQEVNEYEEEEEDTDTNVVEPGGNTVEQPAEDDREPGRRGEEEQEDWTTPGESN